MRTLGVIMIVKNESDCLAECLASAQHIAQEILIGDTGSTDNTIAIARKFGAKVIELAWHDDFAAARNQLLPAATSDWLLHLDADEALDPKGAARIRQIVDADGFGADAVEVTLANYCDAPRAWRWAPVEPGDPMVRGFSGFIAAALLRLFRNRCGFEYREPVHENITESVLERGARIRIEPIVIHHYGYSGNEARARAKAELYLQIARRKIELRPNDPKAWHDLAEQCFACGEAAAAEDASRKAIALDPQHLGAATLLANVLLNRGDLDEARSLLERLEHDSTTAPHVATALGAIACKQGRLDEARRRLGQVVEANPKAIVARLYLAQALDRLGQADDARDHLEKATAAAPLLKEPRDHFKAHRLRTQAKALFARGCREEALGSLTQAMRLNPEDPITQNDLGVVLNSMGQVDRAREALRRALMLAPGMSEAQDNLNALGPPPLKAAKGRSLSGTCHDTNNSH